MFSPGTKRLPYADILMLSTISSDRSRKRNQKQETRKSVSWNQCSWLSGEHMLRSYMTILPFLKTFYFLFFRNRFKFCKTSYASLVIHYLISNARVSGSISDWSKEFPPLLCHKDLVIRTTFCHKNWFLRFFTCHNMELSKYMLLKQSWFYVLRRFVCL